MTISRDFALEIFFSKYEFTLKYNMGGSDLESVTLGYLLSLCSEAEREEWEKLYLGYTETYGSPKLRQAVADTYDTLSPENILCCVGAEEALFALMHGLLTADDHVMVAYPNYQSTETIPLGICEVTGIPLDPARNWALDLDFVKDHIRPNTRFIAVNFPNNPTGKVLDRATFRGLVELCRQHGIYLFSDEVYHRMERSEAIRLGQAADIYERAISLNVLSKAYGLAGLRLGWLASQDTAVLEKAERIKHYLTICSPAPSEFLAAVALNNRAPILERNRRLVDSNLALLNEFMARRAGLFEWTEPDGGCIAYPRYVGPGTVQDFVQRVIDDIGVLLVPADAFQSELGPTPTDRFRVGFGRAYFPQALAELDEYLSKGA